MQLADKRTVGIIYAIKLNPEGDCKESVAHFMMKYSDSPREAYSNRDIERLVENAFADITDYLEYPASLIRDYFYWRQDPWNYSSFNAMCAAISQIQVRRLNYGINEYEYINGFYELNEFFKGDTKYDEII